MAQPKKQSSPRKTGLRRSHLVLKLAHQLKPGLPSEKLAKKRNSSNITRTGTFYAWLQTVI